MGFSVGVLVGEGAEQLPPRLTEPSRLPGALTSLLPLTPGPVREDSTFRRENHRHHLLHRDRREESLRWCRNDSITVPGTMNGGSLLSRALAQASPALRVGHISCASRTLTCGPLTTL